MEEWALVLVIFVVIGLPVVSPFVYAAFKRYLEHRKNLRRRTKQLRQKIQELERRVQVLVVNGNILGGKRQLTCNLVAVAGMRCLAGD